MADIPLVQLPYPEEETKTLYGYITNDNAPPKYDDIMNSNLTKEQKVKAIQDRTNAYKSDVDRQLHKDYARMGAGTALSMASALPLRFLPSWAGAAAGGAMYDLGQGIVEGDTAPDLLKRTTRGALVGGTIGLVPYAANTPLGKMVAESKPGQAVGSALNKAGEKFANSKLYDALMTDVRAFDPNKQTAYHGSPYDFEKFSNEAIGTGEGAQAHGLGHYSALNKDVADTRYANMGYRGAGLSSETESLMRYGSLEDVKNELKNKISYYHKIKNDLNPTQKKWWEEQNKKIEKDLEFLEKNNVSKQLYKLSIPKDDVMLREDALMSNQPNMSNLWDEIRLDRVNKSTTSLPKFKMALGANDIDIDKTFNTKYFNDALEMVKNNPEQYKDLFLKDMTGKELYGYLESVLGSRKAATEYLQQRGIKGISYNGGIDGEARVIFNPDDIDIVRKYYNQPGLFEQLTGTSNSGAAVDSLYNKIAR